MLQTRSNIMASNRKDALLSLVVLSQLIIVALQQLLPLVGFSAETVATYRIFITLLTFIPGIIILIGRRLGETVLVFSIYLIIIVVDYTFFPYSRVFIESKEAITLTPISLLTILFISSIRDFSIFFRVLLYISRVSLIVSFTYVVVHAISPFRGDSDTYSMSFGYSMLLPAMFLFIQHKILDKCSGIILFVLILLAGSRGPVVVLALFYLYYVFFMASFKTKVRLFPLLVIAFILLASFLPKLEIFETSRTMAVLNTSGDIIGYDSGREDELYSVIRPKIFERPLFGWGVGADRFFLDGLYCHNVFLEIYMHFGIIIGSILIIRFIVFVVRLYFSRYIRTKKDGRLVMVLFLLYGFVPLLVSGTYLSTFNVGVAMGVFLALNRKCIGKGDHTEMRELGAVN